MRPSAALGGGQELATAPACERCRRTTPAFYLRCMTEVRPSLGPGDAHLCAHGQGIRVTDDGGLLLVAPARRLRSFLTHVRSLVDLSGAVAHTAPAPPHSPVPSPPHSPALTIAPPPAEGELLSETVRSLISAVDAKDAYTRGHSERVHLAACVLGAAMGLDVSSGSSLYWASLLHDVGKIGAPDHILKKPGKLTPDEYRIMQEHPHRGDEVLAPLTWLREARLGVRHHHERFDGTGYPDGIAGEAIPLIARIIAVVDTFDAVVSRRSYRDARGSEHALQVLREAAGSQLDPAVVGAFLGCFPQVLANLATAAIPPAGLELPAAEDEGADPRRRRAAWAEFRPPAASRGISSGEGHPSSAPPRPRLRYNRLDRSKEGSFLGKESGMKRASTLWIGLTAVAIMVGCGTSMKVTSSWKDPAAPATFNKVLVVGLSSKDTLRRTFETEFATLLDHHGINAVPSATTLPPGVEKDRALMAQAITDGGYDGVIVTRLVDRTKETTYVPGTSYVPAPYYGGYYSYYYTAYPTVYDPGYLVESTIVQIETNLYDVKGDKLVWSGLSEVIDPKTDTQDIRDFSSMVGERMEKDGVIPPLKKS